MPFSNRLRRDKNACEGVTNGAISAARSAFAGRVQCALCSFALATLAGTTVSKAQQIDHSAKLPGMPAKADNASAPISASATNNPAVTGASLTITLNADGQTRAVSVPSGSTVGALLKQENISLGDLDRCSVPLSTPIKNGMQVGVTRIRKQLTVEKHPLAFGTRQRYSSELTAGKKNILTPGKNGERVVTYRDIFKDGQRTERLQLSEKITPARTQVEMVGVRGMTLASRGYFTGKRMVEMVATGYGPGENGPWGSHTASGLRPGRGVVAVDPRFIPLGTRLYVEGYGYCVAGDTGGAIRGNRIDLGMDSYHEAQAVGRRRVRVLILD